MWSYNYSPRLEHHGIIGMKWGVRRYQNKDGSLTSAGKKRYSAEDQVAAAKKKYRTDRDTAKAAWRKEADQYERENKKRSYKSLVNEYTDSDKRLDNAADRYIEDRRKAKEQYKATVRNARKEAVARYTKAYNEHTERQDKHDEDRLAVDSMFEKLGKNKFERTINAVRNKSRDAVAYRKASEDWLNKQDVLNAEWKKVSALYQDTGKNSVERILNNARYGHR